MDYRSANSQQFSVHLKPFVKPSYGDIGFVFPGQGSIRPDLYGYFFKKPIVKEFFQMADDLAHEIGVPPLSSLINMPQIVHASYDESIALRLNLFQYTVQAAIYEYLIKNNLTPFCITAHSFGEFAALYAAGAIDFQTGFQLVHTREVISPKPFELGGLIAVSGSVEQIQKIKFNSDVVFANYNSPIQTVLAVEKKSLKSALRVIRENRIAAKELNTVARPYHSALMNPYAEQFALEILKLDLKFSPLKHNFVSSIECRHLSKNFSFTKETFIEHIKKQLTVPVDFIQQIESMSLKGAVSFLEVGAVKILSGFIKDTLKLPNLNAKTVSEFVAETSIADARSVKETFHVRDKKFFNKIAEFIASVTGYMVEEVQIDHKFEDDLRIDSIKKAEILFKTLEYSNLKTETGLELSRFRFIGDLVEYIEGRKEKGESQSQQGEEQRFYLAKKQLVPAPIAFSPMRDQSFVKWIDSEPIFPGPIKSSHDEDIVLILSKTYNKAEVLNLVEGIEAFLRSRITVGQPFLVLLCAPVDGSSFQAVRAFLLSLQKETNSFYLKSLVSADVLDFEDHEFHQEINSSGVDILYLEGQRFVSTLVEVQDDSQGVKSASPRVILSIGGTKGILQYYYSQALDHRKDHLVIIGRSDSESDVVKNALELFRGQFSSVEYFATDVSMLDPVRTVMTHVLQQHGRIDLVIDASGVEKSKLYLEKKSSEIDYEFNSKFIGIENVLTVCKEKSVELGSYFQFNSVTSQYGNPGQTIYGMGDAWARFEYPKVNHIIWPAIDRLGMTENLGVLQKIKNTGLELLPKSDVLIFLKQILNINSKSQSYHIMNFRDHMLLTLQRVSVDYLRDNFGVLDVKNIFVFKHRIDREKTVALNDHIINGKCIAPGCLGFALMQHLAELIFEKTPVMTGFKLNSLIPLETSAVDIHLEVHPQSFSHVMLKVTSRMENYSMNCFSFDDWKMPDAANLLLEIKAYSLDISQFYSDRYVYHGPAFQVLLSVDVTETGFMIAQGKLGLSIISGNKKMDQWAQICESVFQVAGILATWNDNVSLVPVEVGRIHTCGPKLSEDFYLVSNELVRELSPDRWKTDIFIYNNSSELCYVFYGVIGMRIKTYSKFPIDFSKASL